MLQCANHKEKEVNTACGLCEDYFCDECLVELGGQRFCKKCLEGKLSTVQTPIKPEEEPKNHQGRYPAALEKKSQFWAFLFSLIPGVGYLYLGLMNRGLQTMVLFFGAIFAAGLLGIEEIMALVVPVVMFYSIFDTQQLVKKINAGERVEDMFFFDCRKISFDHKWIGWGLIGVGIIALMRRVPFLWTYWVTIERMIPPIIIIGLGVAILYRNTKKDN